MTVNSSKYASIENTCNNIDRSGQEMLRLKIETKESRIIKTSTKFNFIVIGAVGAT